MAEEIVMSEQGKTTTLPSGVIAINWRLEKRKTGSVYEWWGLFKCTCGNEFTANIYRVKTGVTKSCGCRKRTTGLTNNKKHGQAKDSGRTREYITWESMKQRCLNPKCKAFANYGGRGIKVCDKWQNSFESFFMDMGIKPSNASLERIDVNGDYTPENCRWASVKEQSRNKRNTRWIKAFGQTKSLPQWCEEYSMNYKTVERRILKGWNFERAISQPNRREAVK